MEHCRKCNESLIPDVNWFRSFQKGHTHGAYYLCKKCSTERTLKWRENHPERVKVLTRKSINKRLAKHKYLVFQLLGNKCNNPNCPIPPEKLDKRALQVDHINGGAYREGRKVNWKRQTQERYYKEVYESTLAGSKKYQLLCAYCNWIKRFENHELPLRKES